jgi:hypothetical protein
LICVSVISLCSLTLAAGEVYECTIKVVDIKGQPVINAEVAAHEDFYDYDKGRIRKEPVTPIQKTNEEGIIKISLKAEYPENIWFVARKKGLAVDAIRLSQHSKKPKMVIMLTEPFEVKGNVVDENGKGIAGAYVRLRIGGIIRNRVVSEPEDWFSTKTDEQGQFGFYNIPGNGNAGFFVSAEGKGSFYTFKDTNISWNGQFAPGQKDIKIVMQPCATIKGRIVNEQGNGVQSLGLVLRETEEGYYSIHRTTSSENGEFIFENVREETYFIQVFPVEEGMDEWVCNNDNRIIAKPGKIQEDVTIEVNKGGFVDVLLLDQVDQKPVSDSLVLMIQESSFKHPRYYRHLKTDKQGMARYRAPEGKCMIYYPRPPKDVIVEKGQTGKVTVYKQQEPKIQGKVLTGENQPLSDVEVVVVPPGRHFDNSDEHGRFDIKYETRSEYRYLFARDLKNNLAAAVKLEDNSKSLDVILKKAHTITGRVVDTEGNGIPVVRMQFVVDLANWLAYVGVEVISDIEGYFEITAVPEESDDYGYRINIDAEGYSQVDYYRVPEFTSSKERIDLEPFVLIPANLSVSGKVVDSKGNPIPRIPVFSRSPGSDEIQPERTVISNNEGRFVIRGVCEGPVRLQGGFPKNDMQPGFLVCNGGDEDVTIVSGQDNFHSGASLIGKPLPELKALNIEGTRGGFEEKAVLVCFFDIMQRPSRQCLLRLSKKMQKLERQNIQTIIIQTELILKEDLDGQLQKFNISIPVGIIGENNSEVRLNWGIKSLPWLVLADAEHIVKAEGFGIDELEEKIEQLGAD